MVTPLPANFRVACCQQYLVALGELLSLHADWDVKYRLFLVGDLPLPTTMALLHPSFYEGRPDPRGPRTFGSELLQETAVCQSVRVWGYVCGLPRVAPPVADHLFPYALGGFTCGENKRLLCRLHNQMKSCDLHVFPWEDGQPAWVRGALEAISALRSVVIAQR